MRSDAAHRRGPVFWVTAVAGWGLIGWGVRGALHHHVDTRPVELARFFVAGPLIHDLIVSPLVLAAGFIVARVVSPRWRASVQAGTIVSATLALFAFPEVRDYARLLHNPTSLPHNYTANLAVVVSAVWAATVLITVFRMLRK